MEPVDSGVYIGHRAWECRFEYDEAGRLILRSTLNYDAWRSGEMVATCRHCVEEPPNPSCSCGIYALKDPSKLRMKLKGREGGWVYMGWRESAIMLVFGTVMLWGDRLIDADDGYRAQRARIESLVVPPQDLVPSHLNPGKSWVPIQIDIKKLSEDLYKSYRVPVFEDIKMVYYWEMPEPATTLSSSGGRKPGMPQLDGNTGMVYKSKSAAGKAVAIEYELDSYDHFVWYSIIRLDPTRFRDATRADVDAYNKAHPLSPLRF